MKKNMLLACAVVSVGATVALAVQHHEGWRPESGEMTFSADLVAADNLTQAAVASGHVHAVRAPLTLRSDYLERTADGVFKFKGPTCVTTCTNEVGHTHWSVSGDVEFKADEYVILRDMWVTFYEIPVLYLPYFWYPLDWEKFGFEWMPGYASRWGAFLLTKYSYDILGTPGEGAWLRGSSNFDMRTKNGLAFGQDLKWSLGDFGTGSFRLYYAWDQYASHRYGRSGRRRERYAHWGSKVDRNRYGLGLEHVWQATEKDLVSVRGGLDSDSYFRRDFFRKGFFEIKSQWQTYPNSHVAWEHLENAFAFGAEVSGSLNDFQQSTDRLPEVYFDVNPTPLWNLPINYESQSRLGYLSRKYGKLAAGRDSVFHTNPAPWCDYDTFRFDTYHRLTAPFRTCDDVVSIVPRLGFRGTYWGDSGLTNPSGWEKTVSRDALFRSIGEAGVTFAARGTGWVNDDCQHLIEPYLDVLAQKAWYSGRDHGSRPYVFDNLDASMTWEDQFAGRGRNLPYTYCGVTPGLRNAWSWLEESGNLRQKLELDAYAAFMFGASSFDDSEIYARNASHKLAKLGRANYGKRDVFVAPGFRVKWTPADDISLLARAEYDADHNTLALADVGWRQAATRDFSYTFTYGLRDHRYWDFASIPYDKEQLREDILNDVKFQYVRLGGDYHPFDWLGVGPYIRWDVRENELDCVGTWIDYLTDCLGFRLLVEYENAYRRIDGYRYSDNWHFGFYIYLRALGENNGGLFGR